MVKKDIEPEIASLTAADAKEVSAMLLAARPEYAMHFHPFAFDEQTVREQLARARRDGFWGLRVAGELAGIFMLRGFDVGYQRPAFGVFVAEKFAGHGLARRALADAERWCRVNGVTEMMLSVEPENTVARQIYERAGFAVADMKPGRIVMTKEVAA